MSTSDIITTQTQITTIETHYNSAEAIKEVEEIIKNPEDVIKQLNAPVGDNVNAISAELNKSDPNYVKIGLSILFIILSLCGTFFGVWFGTRK